MEVKLRIDVEGKLGWGLRPTEFVGAASVSVTLLASFHTSSCRIDLTVVG